MNPMAQFEVSLELSSPAGLAIRGIEGNLGSEPSDSFHRDLHKDLKAGFWRTCLVGERVEI
jgi:hypothetical protein